MSQPEWTTRHLKSQKVANVLVRQSLGAVLLQARQLGRAERIYREDLSKFPENGWSLFGLMKALRVQGKVKQARDVEGRHQEAWQRADIVLSSSRF